MGFFYTPPRRLLPKPDRYLYFWPLHTGQWVVRVSGNDPEVTSALFGARHRGLQGGMGWVSRQVPRHPTTESKSDWPDSYHANGDLRRARDLKTAIPSQPYYDSLNKWSFDLVAHEGENPTNEAGFRSHAWKQLSNSDYFVYKHPFMHAIYHDEAQFSPHEPSKIAGQLS
jgi:hypothetical protein